LGTDHASPRAFLPSIPRPRSSTPPMPTRASAISRMRWTPKLRQLAKVEPCS
jgi:hypothetical protein